MIVCLKLLTEQMPSETLICDLSVLINHNYQVKKKYLLLKKSFSSFPYFRFCPTPIWSATFHFSINLTVTSFTTTRSRIFSNNLLDFRPILFRLCPPLLFHASSRTFVVIHLLLTYPNRLDLSFLVFSRNSLLSYHIPIYSFSGATRK